MQKTFLAKKWLPAFLLVALVLGLAACGKKSVLPIGSLTDDVYLSGDGYSITEKELYLELRYDGLNSLMQLVDEKLFATQLATINANPAEYREELIKSVNQSVFGTTDLEVIAKYTAEQKAQQIASYIDSFFLVGIEITEADIENYTDVVLDYYKIDLAKKLYAKAFLIEETQDSNHAQFITAANIETYFNNNHKGRMDVDAILVRFINKAEADATLRHFGLKSYRNQFYQVPVASCDPADVVGYEACYNAYTINPDRAVNPDVPLTEEEALIKFIEIYNFIYTYRDALDASWDANVDSIEDILAGIAGEPRLSHTYQSLTAMNATLRSYIYNTLTTEAGGIRYTSTPRSYGNFHYMVYKIDQADEAELTDELKDEIREILFNQRLSQTYINTKVNNLYKETDIKIYDPILQLQYATQNTNYKTVKATSTVNVASVNGEPITVDAFYAKMEKVFGANVAFDLATRQILTSSKYASYITDAEMKEYRDTYRNIMNNFVNDAYAMYGYPASMGKENFMRLYFRANNNEEAIQKIFVQNKLETLFLEDYEAHYGPEVYEKLAQFAAVQKDAYFSITLQHLLVYIDMDENGQPDNPKDYLETLDAQERLDFETNVYNFMKFIENEVKQYASLSTGMNTIVEQFNRSTRIVPSSESCQTNPTVECKWAQFKRQGFMVKVENLGALTNASKATYDQDFFARVEKIFYDEDFNQNGVFHSQWLDAVDSPYVDGTGYSNLVESAFGYHMILATNGAVSRSAKFTAENDTFLVTGDQYKIYERIEYKDQAGNVYYLNAYSDTDYPSVNQIRIYMNEQSKGIENLPTTVKQALDAYFLPVLTRYKGDANSRVIIYDLILDTNFTFANSANEARALEIIEINRRQMDEYKTDGLFANWWNVFN